MKSERQRTVAVSATTVLTRSVLGTALSTTFSLLTVLLIQRIVSQPAPWREIELLTLMLAYAWIVITVVSGFVVVAVCPFWHRHFAINEMLTSAASPQQGGSQVGKR